MIADASAGAQVDMEEYAAAWLAGCPPSGDERLVRQLICDSPKRGSRLDADGPTALPAAEGAY